MISDIWKSLVFTLISVISLVSNGLLIPVILKCRQIYEDAATPLLIALCVSDFLQGAFSSGISSILSWTSSTNDSISTSLKQFHTFILVHTRLSSLHLVTALAVIKMVTVIKPLRVVNILTKTRIWIIIIVCCTTPSLVSLAAFALPVAYSSTFKDSYFKRGTKSILLSVILPLEVFTSLSILLVSTCIIFGCVVRQIIIVRKLIAPLAFRNPENVPNQIPRNSENTRNENSGPSNHGNAEPEHDNSQDAGNSRTYENPSLVDSQIGAASNPSRHDQDNPGPRKPAVSAPLNPILTAMKTSKAIIALCSVYVIVYIIGTILQRLQGIQGFPHTAEARFIIYRLYDSNGFVNVFTYLAFCKPAKRQLKRLLGYSLTSEP